MDEDGSRPEVIKPSTLAHIWRFLGLSPPNPTVYISCDKIRSSTILTGSRLHINLLFADTPLSLAVLFRLFPPPLTLVEKAGYNTFTINS